MLASTQHYDSASGCSYHVSDTATSFSVAGALRDSSSQPTSLSYLEESVGLSLASHARCSVVDRAHGVSGRA